MNEVDVVRGGGIVEPARFTAEEIRERVNVVQAVLHGVMKEGTHYGTLPGSAKQTLYKPGAELLCLTFRIFQGYEIEDLSTPGCARFRVRCIGRHQVTGAMLGEGVGECSSDEEKFKWRAAVCPEEFEDTPENLRRVKYAKYKGNVERKRQVKTECADMANTVLKMACKRALIAMTLNVTAASDMFTQDIEDLPEEFRNIDGGAPALSPLALKWIAEAEQKNSEAELVALYREAAQEFEAAKDTKAAEALRAACAKRRDELNAQAGGKDE